MGTNRSLAVAVVGSALVAGLAAYLVQQSRKPAATAAGVPVAPRSAVELAEEVAARAQEATEARELVSKVLTPYLREKLLPELRPVLLEGLHILKEVVDENFRRAEQAIREL